MSEFGQGLVYNLGLFLAHAERARFKGYQDEYAMWWNGAGDHLFDLEDKLPWGYSDLECYDIINDKLGMLKSTGLSCRNVMTDRSETELKNEMQYCIQLAKEILLLIDTDILCVNAVEAEYD